jgi:hypothetical protein
MVDRVSIQIGADTGPLTDGLASANDAVAGSAAQMQQSWGNLTTQMTASFSQVNEFIQTTFTGINAQGVATQTALQLANQAIASDFASLGQTMTASWTATQGALTAASLAGANSQTAIAQDASTQMLASLAQSAISSINNSALTSFAGVFANLSPTLGPGAAVPAASAQATVAAAASSIASAAGGWQVPEDTLAYVHKDEKILPAKYSQGLDTMVENANNGAGAGGGDTHFHINAIDSQSAAAFIKNNMGQIVSGLKQQQRNFALPGG